MFKRAKLAKGVRMNGYHVDWVGAISAGIIAGLVIFLLKTAFPRLKGVSFYLVLGILIAGSSLAVRELLRRIWM